MDAHFEHRSCEGEHKSQTWHFSRASKLLRVQLTRTRECHRREPILFMRQGGTFGAYIRVLDIQGKCGILAVDISRAKPAIFSARDVQHLDLPPQAATDFSIEG